PARTTPDSAGRYVAANRPLGRYEVTAHATAFEAPSQDAFVTSGSSITANFNLALGAPTQSIEINADTPGVDTTRTAPKAVLTDLQIHNLPFVGRRVQNLIVQMPQSLIAPEGSAFSV